MKGSVFKNIIREIWDTKARFLSILAIIGLGAGFFVGVKAAGPSMVNTLVNYVDEQNMMDIRLVSSVGFDDDDVSEIAKTQGVAEVQAGYFTDAVMSDQSKKSVVRLHSLGEDDKMNVPLLVEGRLPQRSGEIVVEEASYANPIEIGSKITLESTIMSRTSGKEEEIPLECNEFTVVGKVKSPLYISFQKGKTTVGNGTISYYMLILPQDFTSERYTELYLVSDCTKNGVYPYSDEYNNEIAELKKRLETVCDERLKVFDKNEIEPKRQELADGKDDLIKAEKDANDEFATAYNNINSSQTQFEKLVVPSGNKAMIARSKSQLDAARKQFQSNQIKADHKFAQEKKKLFDAQKELEQFDDLKSVVTTRDDSPGYSEFQDNAGRVEAVATVFPVFFVLVAILVCVTTMTRMVEERRTEIGTFKALGYSNGTIISKYVIYSTTAGVIGCAVGCAVGCATLPRIIFNAYAMMYQIKAMDEVTPWECIIGGFIVAIICTAIVSWFTCRSELKRSPASLMRPKAPKAGKRNLLERIGFIWNKMKFTSKVTARNLFRYKARFFMTVIGVAGCTALIVAAFGLKDAIGSIVDKQFGEINSYNLSIVFSDSKTVDDADSFVESLTDRYNLESSMPVYQNEITVYDNKSDSTYGDTYLIVPSRPSELRSIIDLHSRQTGEKIELDDGGCVMSEKLADNMGLAVGDEFKIKDVNDDIITLRLSAICENYLYSYVYITPNYYNECFGKDVEYNMVDTHFNYETEQQRDALANTLLEDKEIVAVNYTESGVDNFRKMLSTLNMVVYVMIVSAGALAFVVLYNLTNINIAERAREIATIKVLGFYNREVGGYIYRENVILTILGALAGLVLGIFLTGFIVRTVEVDIVMFGREIMPQSFLYALGLTFLFAIIVNFFMYFKMKNIDMVESLKSIE
ncbi:MULTISPECIES: FtsX-like permease family protein [unclassified Ruminococcus]|uniref:FtsX-like permease family protein n=1 Tax=unclassified Ruminococcus TaxID=2608920 RepID=UPI002108E585|nr:MULTISPECIES: FtsX-like permease family protein [unclassified Ruminococcus]MCQ4021831.1 FtsX-like permease family protein [Ruminococcus sp. zg-924]MCQ4114276.1 FtsX-like permease family protein [Ruminococcus sp. zg-921]